MNKSILLLAVASTLLSACTAGMNIVETKISGIPHVVSSYGVNKVCELSPLKDYRNENFKHFDDCYKAFTPQDFKKFWGEPDLIVSNGGTETLIYRPDIAWRGVIPFISFLHVPLLIPAGHNEIRIEFRDGALVGYEEESADNHLGPRCGLPTWDLRIGCTARRPGVW